jgi:hypothetical protein
MRSSSSAPRRWPLVVAAPSEAPRGRRLALVLGPMLAVAIAIAPVGVVASRLLLSASLLVALFFFARRGRRAIRASGATIVADAEGLTRSTAEGQKPIVRWDAPFGVTLLASYGRPHALLAFTTPSHTRYVPTRIDPRTDTEDELFARIAVLGDLDLVDGIAHDAALTPRDAAEVVRRAEERSPSALGRVYLSDGRGDPIALDRATLSLATRTFDLTSQLEWRALMFHESTGQAAALYQATWIRQSGVEVVLVAPMPASIVPREPNAHKEASGRLGRALTRDLRLLQSPAEPPPARDVRVAIDRPFMLAVRRALDEAPLALRLPAPSAKARSAGRDSMV